MQLSVLIIALAAVARPVLCSYDPIVGYTPSTNVMEHSEIDLDQADLETYLKETNENSVATPNYAAARTIYMEGEHSVKGGGKPIRTLAGFSTGLHGKAEPSAGNEAMYLLYNKYYGAHPIDGTGGNGGDGSETQYGHKLVMAGLEANMAAGDMLGTDSTTYAALPDAGRIDLIKKSTVYSVSWMYVIHELEDAVGDCHAGTILNNDLNPDGSAPKAWDEGWAFWAGSTGSKMTYTLAEKRCKDYGTCTGENPTEIDDGISTVNDNLLDMYNKGSHLLTQGRCNELSDLVREMEVQMSIPLLQGTLKYAWKLGHPEPRAGLGAIPAKEAGEAWAFAAAILPQIDNCNPDVATDMRAKLDLIGVDTCPITLDQNQTPQQKAASVAAWTEFYGSVISTYACLGFTCADMGGYRSDDGTTGTAVYYDDFEPCSDDGNGEQKLADPNVYTWCEAGEYKHIEDSGEAHCDQCPAGTSSKTIGAGYGTVFEINPCNACPPGSFSAAGATSCTACAAGTYNGASGAASCTECPAGSVAASGNTAVDSGATACLEVPDSKKKSSSSDDGGMIIGLVIAAVFAAAALGMTAYACTMKSNYDKLVAEQGGGVKSRV